MVTLNEAVVILITGDHAPANFTGLYQRRLHIHHVALFVPAAISGRDVAFERLTVSVFTHHIHIRRRVAGAAHQPGRAAHDFDFVVNRRVARGVAKVPAVIKKRRHIFVGEIADVKTAREKVGPAGVNARGGHAHGVFQHIFNGVQLLILHALLANDAYGLRNVARHQEHFRTGCGGFDAVIL